MLALIAILALVAILVFFWTQYFKQRKKRLNASEKFREQLEEQISEREE